MGVELRIALRELVSEIDFTPGRVTFAEAFPDLKEDLLQVEFPEDYVLDVGWYPDGDEDGSFTIVVFKHEWERQLQKKSTTSDQELKLFIAEAADFVRAVLRSGGERHDLGV